MPFVERDGLRVHYEARGEGRRTVLFAHNLLTDGGIFRAFVDRFSRSHRCVAVDLRGHGGSRGVRAPFTTRDLAGDLAAIADAEGADRVSVIGVSLGAQAAVELALAHPKRVQALFLMGATGRAQSALDVVANRILALLLDPLGFNGFVATRALSVLFGPTFRAEQPDAVAVWRGRIGALDGRDAALAVGAWASRRRQLDAVTALRAPVWIAVGEEDGPCPPRVAVELGGAIAGARVERLAGAGHTIPLEQPVHGGDLVERFLAETANA